MYVEIPYHATHKNKDPIRYIVSSVDCMAKSLSNWLLLMLAVIAGSIGKHQVKSACELFDKIEGQLLNSKDNILVTWDFNYMFTNIPFQD